MKLSDLYKSNPYQGDPNCVVAVVRRNGFWLLGKSTVGRRKNKWCFPGGMMEGTETVEETAVRECLEETGIQTRPEEKLGKVHYRCVAVLCYANNDGPLMPNHEFSELRWMSSDEIMMSDEVLPANKELICMARSQH